MDVRTEEMMNRARSLQLEHVSPAGLMQWGISRSLGFAEGNEASILALLRRWFFARKPDAGFVLTDFPATLLQARVFDEWLDVRDEEIDAVVAGPGASGPVVEHYRTLGLLVEEPVAAR
jgi:adenylate kinase